MPLEQPSPEATYRRFVLAALAAHPGTPGDIVLAGPAAAVLLGLPLFGRAPTVVHVAAPHDHGRKDGRPVSYTHLRAHETVLDLVCRLLLEKKKKTNKNVDQN